MTALPVGGGCLYCTVQWADVDAYDDGIWRNHATDFGLLVVDIRVAVDITGVGWQGYALGEGSGSNSGHCLGYGRGLGLD